jgi:hypothetical protein
VSESSRSWGRRLHQPISADRNPREAAERYEFFRVPRACDDVPHSAAFEAVAQVIGANQDGCGDRSYLQKRSARPPVVQAERY